MKKKALNTLLIILAASICGYKANAQVSVDRLMALADSARLAYDFASAASFCQKAV